MKKPISKIKILDCTLRDGGYYNNWDFEPKTVQQYITAMSLSGIDMVEIGFRLKPANVYYGAFAYSTDEYLDSLKIPESVNLAVMINASEFHTYPSGAVNAVNVFFREASNSPVSMVRVALRVSEIVESKPIILALKSLGYKVTVNLMQVDVLSSADIIDAAQEIQSWNSVDVFYFADSLGSLDPDITRTIIKTLRKAWSGELGFHAHDNKGQALVNCIAAITSGVTWVDGTILGMGRGAGNVSTESLIVEVTSRKLGAYNLKALYSLVMVEFKELQKKYKWGPNLFYHLAAVEGVHPTYIQELINSERYNQDDILDAIKYLGSSNARSYNNEILGNAILNYDSNTSIGTWSASGYADGKDVLIIGAGPSTIRHSSTITNFINTKKPIVLSLNVNRAIQSELVTAYVACHESRILFESIQYSDLNRPVILPLARVPDRIKALLEGVEIYDYGLGLSDEKIEIKDTGCTLPSTLAVAYAIAVAISSGARRIMMVGFDGYPPGDPRQDEMIMLLEKLHNHKPDTQILAITPSTYPIIQRSIYEPDL